MRDFGDSTKKLIFQCVETLHFTGIKGKVPDTETVPVSLRKMKEIGLWNPIFEVDLGDSTYNFDKFTMDDMCALVEKWITWAHDNLHEESKVFINFRDLPDVMPTNPERCLKLTQFIATLPERIRPFGIMFEEPRGRSLPEECGMWARYIRKVMDLNNYNAHLLVHVHEKFGYAEATALQVSLTLQNSY